MVVFVMNVPIIRLNFYERIGLSGGGYFQFFSISYITINSTSPSANRI